MMKRSLVFVVSIVIAALIIKALFYSSPKMYKESRFLLGTVCSISLYGDYDKKAAAEKAFAAIKKVETEMNIFDSESHLSHVNKSAFYEPAQLLPDTEKVLKIALDIADKSNGAFDVTTKPLTDLWGFTSYSTVFPEKDEVAEARERVGYQNLSLLNGKLRFRREGMQVDLGGIAKGYACDLAVDALRAGGVKNALVNVGGNIYALGTAPDRDGWLIGLRDPRKKDSILQEKILLSDEAISTSGDYEQFFLHEGERFSHIIDPKTGFPVKNSVTVSVILRSATFADAYSTAFFVMGAETAKENLLIFNVKDILFVSSNREGFDIWKKGRFE